MKEMQLQDHSSPSPHEELRQILDIIREATRQNATIADDPEIHININIHLSSLLSEPVFEAHIGAVLPE